LAKELTTEQIKERLDNKIAQKYAHYRRGINSASDELEVLQQFRYEIFGARIDLDMNTKPEGAGRCIF
jgi:hypothetical protein